MPDPNQAYLVQQQELLREIRDEIRQGRLSTSGAVSGATFPGGISRPSSALLMAQTQLDRGLAGEWSSFGWTNAYKPYIEANFGADLAAFVGLRRAPNTLTQAEFQAFAVQNFAHAMGRVPAGILAPRFSGRVDAMAQDILTFSPQFLRAGDTGAGFLGFGADLTGARQMAATLQLEAARDTRLSGAQYQDIFRTSAAAGQFDFGSSLSDVTSQFRALAQTVADLSKTTRMSIDEITQSMGALRQFGVVDLADQRRIVSGIDSFARVAGVSPGQMASVVQPALAAGAQLGLAASTSAALAAGNFALTRNLSRSGVLSGAVVAAGGGAQQIAASITGAQQAFLASDAGVLAALGGGEFLSGLSSGLGAVGSLSDFAAFSANRVDILNRLSASPDAASALYRNRVMTQLRMAGIRDFEGAEATNMAYVMLRGEMGDAGALAYSRSEFSAEGRRAAQAARMNAGLYSASREAALRDDEYFRHTSFAGRAQSLMRDIVAIPAGWSVSARDLFSPGQSGYDFLGIGPRVPGRYETDARALASGAMIDRIDPGAFANLNLGGLGGAAPGGPLTLTAPSGAGRALGYGAIGTAAGLALALTPVGWAVGSGLALAGGLIGFGIGASSGGSDVQLNASQASAARALIELNAGGSTGRAEAMALLGRAQLSGEFTNLLQSVSRNSTDFSRNPAAAAAYLTSVSRAAAAEGTSDAAIIQALGLSGFSAQLPGSYTAGAGATDQIVSTKLLAGVSASTGSLATGAASGALKRLLQNPNDPRAMRELAALGVRDDDLRRLLSNARSLDPVERESVVNTMGNREAIAGNREAMRLLRGLSIGLQGTGLSGDAAALLESPEKLGEALLVGDSAARRQVMAAMERQGGSFRDLAGLLNDTLEGSDAEIARRYRLSSDVVSSVRTAAGSDLTKLRTGLFMNAMQNALAETSSEERKEELSHQLVTTLGKAAAVLNALASRFKVETA